MCVSDWMLSLVEDHFCNTLCLPCPCSVSVNVTVQVNLLPPYSAMQGLVEFG